MGQLLNKLQNDLTNPSPHSNPNPDPEEESIRKEFRVYRSEALKNKMIADLAIGATPPGQETDPGAYTALATMFKAQADNSQALMNTFLTQIHDLQTRQPSAMNDPVIQTLQRDLTELKAATARAPQDPFDVWQKMDEIINKARGGVGVPHATGTSPSEMAVMLQIEELKLTREERTHQWELEREDRKAQQAIDLKKWEMEMDMKRVELYDSLKHRELLAKDFGDFFGSLGSSINLGAVVSGQPQSRAGVGGRPGQGHTEPASQPRGGQPPQNQPPVSTAVVCQQCSYVYEIPAGFTEYPCPECETINSIAAGQPLG